MLTWLSILHMHDKIAHLSLKLDTPKDKHSHSMYCIKHQTSRMLK